MSMKKTIVILYTESKFTPYTEYIVVDTIIDIYNGLKIKYDVSFCNFTGFNDQTLKFLKEFDLVFNMCYGYKLDNITQDEVVKWLDDNSIKHTVTTYESHYKCMDKSLYPELTAKIENLYSPSNYTGTECEYFIQKPKCGGCHRDTRVIRKGTIMEFNTDHYLFTEYIIGREITVAIIPDKIKGYITSNYVEILSTNNNPYFVCGLSSKFIHDAQVSTKLYNTINNALINLCKQLNTRGIIRVDLKITNEDKIYLLDINAMPNLDKLRSFLPNMMHRSGIPFNQLMELIVENADS